MPIAQDPVTASFPSFVNIYSELAPFNVEISFIPLSLLL